MLAIKFLPTDNPRTSGVHYGTGLYTLHHLLTRRSCLTNQQSKNAWFILGRGEIPDLYAHLICAQLHDTDRNAVVGMAAVLEGHTQAISQASRDPTADHSIIYLRLTLLDMIAHADRYGTKRRQMTSHDGYISEPEPANGTSQTL